MLQKESKDNFHSLTLRICSFFFFFVSDNFHNIKGSMNLAFELIRPYC